MENEVRDLTEHERQLFSQMRRSIRDCGRRNRLRRNLYDAKTKLDRIGFSVPPHMVDFQTPVGWAEKAVSVPAARIRREGFRMLNDSSLMEDLNEIFDDPHTQRVEAGATKSSLKHGPAFMFMTRGDTDAGEPPVVFTPKSALEASCIQNRRTGEVTAALEVISRRKALLYMPGLVVELIFARGPEKWVVSKEYPQGHDLVLCEPYVWDWDIDRPFGRSRISRPLIGLMDRGVRTLLRGEVTAEFFSAPQRGLMGASSEHFTDPDGNPIDIWKVITGSIWALPDVWDDDEGKLVRPQLQQLQQASMQPHFDMFKSVALQVASELDMPIRYLGVQENQPAAEGAIKAEEASMVALIEHQIQISYKLAARNLARKALAAFHNQFTEGMRKDLRGLSVRFADAGTPTASARADSALKYKTSFPDGDPVLAMELYGLTDEQIRRNEQYMRRNQAGSTLDRLLAQQGNNSAAPPGAAAEDGA